MKLISTLVVAAIALALSLIPAADNASAQEGNRTTGIIVGVETNEAGELVRFAVSNSGGEITTFEVSPQTEYGLENQAGDRWTATQADEPVEAAQRLRGHQERFAPVVVQSANGVAGLVVELEESGLETNLGFLFAVFGVTWALFFAYIFFMSRKQRELQREVVRLRARLEQAANE